MNALQDAVDTLVMMQAKLEAWAPLVREALRRANDPDGGEDLEDLIQLALEIPEELRPAEPETKVQKIECLFPRPISINFCQGKTFPPEPGPVNQAWLLDLVGRVVRGTGERICGLMVVGGGVSIEWPDMKPRVFPVRVELVSCENGHAFKICGLESPDNVGWCQLSDKPSFVLPADMEMLTINTGMKIRQVVENMGEHVPWPKTYPCSVTRLHHGDCVGGDEAIAGIEIKTAIEKGMCKQ